MQMLDSSCRVGFVPRGSLEEEAKCSRLDPPATPTGLTPPRPHGTTYWVAAGRLLAGEYPGAQDDDTAAIRLGRYLDAGVDFFIDLTENGELEPYEDRLYAEVAARGKEVEYRRFPIRDLSVPRSPDQMREILD